MTSIFASVKEPSGRVNWQLPTWKGVAWVWGFEWAGVQRLSENYAFVLCWEKRRRLESGSGLSSFTYTCFVEHVGELLFNKSSTWIWHCIMGGACVHACKFIHPTNQRNNNIYPCILNTIAQKYEKHAFVPIHIFWPHPHVPIPAIHPLCLSFGPWPGACVQKVESKVRVRPRVHIRIATIRIAVIDGPWERHPWQVRLHVFEFFPLCFWASLFAAEDRVQMMSKGHRTE